MSNISIHIIGKEENFFKAQQSYFTSLSLAFPDNYLSLCDSKNEYLEMGKLLWHQFKFQSDTDNVVEGKLYIYRGKGGYFYHQWLCLSKILTEYCYSFSYLHVGQEQGDTDSLSNMDEVAPFYEKVLQHFYLSEENGQKAIICI